MSDQFGNHVDKEVWVPLKANDWIDDIGVGKGKFDYVFATPTARMEYCLGFADGSVDSEGTYTSERDATLRLGALRRELALYKIPEDYWPILMEREVSITRSSWKPMDV